MYRVPYVLAGTPLFKVFSQFGELILAAAEPRWLVRLLGWTYHFSHGAALGIMFLTASAHLVFGTALCGAVGDCVPRP